jgi:DNA-binding PadR family transcriptional regulator
MHGHQIRRQAQIDRTELWTDIKVGSLYAALHRLAEDGLIEAVRTEREGNMPARTVYDITPEGHKELVVLRSTTLRATSLRPDPVDLALQFSVETPEPKLRMILEDRRQAIEADLSQWRHTKDHARPFTNDMEQAVIEHSIRRLECELAWHDDLIDHLPKLLADTSVGGQPRPKGPRK